MDGIELLIGVEDAFGIEIPDRDAAKLISVGQLYDYVRSRVGREGICPSRHVFYRLRGALECGSGVARGALRPDTPLETVLPSVSRLHSWADLATRGELNLPRLRRPEWVFVAGITIFATGMVATLLCSVGAFQLVPSHWTFILLTGGALLLLWLITVPLAVSLPLHCQSLGDLTRIVSAMNSDELEVSLGWGDSEIWQTVRVLISQQMGIPVEQVTAEKQFIRDLGMG